MRTIFIRHPESTKNVSGQFSSHENQEPLTDRGVAQVEQVTGTIGGLLQLQAFAEPFHLFSATSLRAEKLAQSLSRALGVIAIQNTCLNSIDSGNVAGLDREQMEEVAPGYFHEMELYESGVMNAYSINHSGEPLLEFESRVATLLQDIESRTGTAFVVLHKSAATAALINYGRRIGKYPDSFFGYIPLDTVSVSVVDTNAGQVNIRGVNMPCGRLSEIVR